MDKIEIYDVAIIGGGPAGSTAAALLARAGRRSTKLCGDRWLLAGDAAGFIDPIFSSGVFLAVFSGEQGADVLHEVLDHPQRAKKLFRRYERAVNRAMNIYLRFVNGWYTKEFVEVFLTPRNVLGVAPTVTAVLGGNVGNSFGIRWRMWVLYFLVWMQKHFGIVPRRTLVPKRETSASPADPIAA